MIYMQEYLDAVCHIVINSLNTVYSVLDTYITLL